MAYLSQEVNIIGVYTQFKDGMLIEATFGDTTTIQAATQTYIIGALTKRFKHPSPTAVLHKGPPAVNSKETAYIWKGAMDCIGAGTFVFQNGVPLKLVMGKSATTGPVGSVYTHTITPTDDGSDIPSFSWQHERTGTATDWAVQFTGCKMASLSLLCSQNGRYLIGATNIIAQKARDPAFVLTNDPTLPPTATSDPYKFSGMTRTWDYGSANTALDGLIEMELNISPDLDTIRTATWDAGTWTGQWPYKIIDGAQMKYELTMHMHPESDDLWDELVSLTNTKELYFKWTKSTDDYIEATLTNCWVTAHPLYTDTEEGAIEVTEVTIVPEKVSFTVKDTIAGGYYGE